MVFVGFGEQQPTEGNECMQIVVVVWQFGITVAMGSKLPAEPEDVTRTEEAVDDLAIFHFRAVQSRPANTRVTRVGNRAIRSSVAPARRTVLPPRECPVMAMALLLTSLRVINASSDVTTLQDTMDNLVIEIAPAAIAI